MQYVQEFFDRQQQHQMRLHLVALAALVVMAMVSVGFGPAGWNWQLAFAWMLPDLFPQVSELQLNIVTQIRLPRFCLAVLVGAVLAQTGCATQALCRNPLADPTVIGISSGAAVCAVAVIALAPIFHFNADAVLPYVAFLGALATTVWIYHSAKQDGEVNVTTLILIGVAVNALSFALIGLFSFYADDSSLRLINYWTMGSLAGANWQSLFQAAPLLCICMFGLFTLRSKFTLLLLGESNARYMGVDTQKLKQQSILLVALGVGVAVSLTGLIGFVGLVIPHITRLLIGNDYQKLMPLAMLIGASVMLLADWLARVLVAPNELPIGIITAILGTPVFLYLLKQQARSQK